VTMLSFDAINRRDEPAVMARGSPHVASAHWLSNLTTIFCLFHS
jgi:hypothetical protein